MDIIRTFGQIEEFGRRTAGCALTIGNFDGVHIGHGRILAEARRAAEELKTELAVMTFEPHPAALLHPERAPVILTPPKMKRLLLERFKVDCLVVLEDSLAILNLAPKEFVRRFLIEGIRPAVVIEGENFHFGYGRSGNVHTLGALGVENGFRVVAAEQERARLSIGHAVEISSTLVRDLLAAGKVSDAAIALGRPYRLIGKTVAGRGKGRELGFPTANIEPAEQVVPAEGVYAGLVEIGDEPEQVCVSSQSKPAALSIGRAKTFVSEHPLLVEAHLLGGGIGDLGGKYLAMDFVERIRGQRRFESKADLSGQIGRDCRKIREILQKGFDTAKCHGRNK
jgi:riboflavin kinase/FMN adenylyltransferase